MAAIETAGSNRVSLDEQGVTLFEEQLRRLYQALRTVTFRALARRKLSYSAAIVLFIVKRRGAATMSEIGRELGLANSTVTGLIDTLEGRNLVQRYSDENDRRVAWVRLTHAGEEEIAYVRARRVEALRQWLPDVSEAELATCLAVFEKMLKAVALDPDNLPEQKGS